MDNNLSKAPAPAPAQAPTHVQAPAQAQAQAPAQGPAPAPHRWRVAIGLWWADWHSVWQSWRCEPPTAVLRRLAWLRMAEKGPRLLTFLCCATVLLFCVWASWAKLDEVARGSGQVVPSQRVQQIQNLEGGILQGVMVTEGQVVEQGDLLARLDNETAGSQYREALARGVEHEAAIARLEALINSTEPEYPPKVLAVPEMVQRQNDILAATRAQLTSEIQVLQSQYEGKVKEAEEQEERLRQLATQLGLSEKQLNLARPALQARAFSALEFVNLEQKAQALKSELASLEISIPRLRLAAGEALERLSLRRAEMVTQSRREINEIQTRLLSLRELLTAGSDKVLRTELRSPVRGTVKKIHMNTVGGVIAPGATLMEVVPLDDTLIIEARFSPTDIAFLYPGQQAVVRLSAYDFAVYGGLEALVEHISADTMEGKQGEFFYQVKLRTTQKSLLHKGHELPILVGMVADVDVLTGKKTVMDYLLKPILKVRQRALSER